MEEQIVTITVKTQGAACEMTDAEIKAWYHDHVARLFDPAYGTPDITIDLCRKSTEPCGK